MTEAAVRERPVTSRQIKVGDVPIGGGAQVAVQSMTNTMTYDVEATVQQVYDLNAAGADLVRVSVNGSKALKGFREVVWRSPVPLIADIHFDYRMALGRRGRGRCLRPHQPWQRRERRPLPAGHREVPGDGDGHAHRGQLRVRREAVLGPPEGRGARGERLAQGGDRRGDGLLRLQGLPQGEPRPRDGRGQQEVSRALRRPAAPRRHRGGDQAARRHKERGGAWANSCLTASGTPSASRSPRTRSRRYRWRTRSSPPSTSGIAAPTSSPAPAAPARSASTL